MESKFKIGDIVKVNQKAHYYIGKIGVVTAVSRESAFRYAECTVEFDDDILSYYDYKLTHATTGDKMLWKLEQ
jgi:hypothetical protein